MRALGLILKDMNSLQAKTRLRDALGAERTAALQSAVASDLVKRLRAGTPPGQPTAAVSSVPSSSSAPSSAPGASAPSSGDPDVRLFAPAAEAPFIDLGTRIHAAFTEASDAGAESTVLVTTDFPRLSKERVQEAFAALDTHDLVLGPTRDGGHYLVGLRHPVADLFERIPWNTYAATAEILARAWRLELRVAVLPEEGEVDTAAALAELARLHREQGEKSGVGPETARFLAELGGAGSGPDRGPEGSSER
jgi:glycosyltransferase A (GT-A) superfamily protein (DUF2064 family)